MDVVSLILLAGLAGALSWTRSDTLDPLLYQYELGTISTSDVWFDADIPKTVLLMTNRWADQHRVTTEHPLISLIVWTPVKVLTTLGVPEMRAIRLFIAAQAALWTAVLFVLLRRLGSRLLDAAVFTGLGLTSACATFWLIVPETFLTGAIGLMLGLVVLTLTPSSRWSHAQLVLVGLLTMSVTITNWMLGLLANLARGWRGAWHVTASTFLIVAALWAVQKIQFPAAQFFLGSTRTAQFVHAPTPSRIVDVVTSMAVSTIVMPPLGTQLVGRGTPGLSVQASRPWSSGYVSVVAVVSWLALLALAVPGVRDALRGPHAAVWRVLLGFAAFGLLLHTVFGRERLSIPSRTCRC